MISVAEVIAQFRINQKDINEVKYSEWDIVNALNEALRLISNEFSMRNTDFLEKTVVMLDSPTLMTVPAPADARIADGNLMGQELPADFVSEVNVRRASDGYKMSPSQGLLNHMNYMVYQSAVFALDPIIFKYRYSLPKVDATSNIDLPVSFFDFLVRSTIIALGEGGMDALDQFVSENAMKLIPSRRYANAKVSMPWRV